MHAKKSESDSGETAESWSVREQCKQTQIDSVFVFSLP